MTFIQYCAGWFPPEVCCSFKLLALFLNHVLQGLQARCARLHHPLPSSPAT